MQVPVVSQPPVKRKTLTPIDGFFGSPHNLNAILFDIKSNNGSFSQVSSIDVKPLVLQSIQSVHVSQVVQLGVQTGVVFSQLGVEVGTGVGVGVGSIITGQLCV